MTTIVTIPTSVSVAALAASRESFVAALGSTYGAARTYAADVLGFFRAEGHGDQWVTMAHDAKGPAGDAMRTERDALYEALRKGGHSNPSVYWKRIKEYAQGMIDAERKAEAEAAGETVESESEGTGKKQTRSLQLRLVEELTTLFKACKKDKATLTKQQTEAFTHVTSALSALGVDVSQL